MTNLFRGRHEVRLDSKGRLCLPANYRAAVDEVGGSTEFVITNSQVQGQPCLDVYHITEWERLENEFSLLPRFQKEVSAFRRFYLACGQVSRLDSQNRILIPGQLRDFAKLSGDIVLLGMGKKFEVWSQSTWENLHGGMAKNFDSIMESIAELSEVVC
ncbi:MAG: division/cell wall cluster transcriptional repressor MraZ [Bdellovibrionales bacterium]|nr:division/cell wall cluster transcriptional repressor MraZ [Bdellovibrionales bacterium]